MIATLDTVAVLTLWHFPCANATAADEKRFQHAEPVVPLELKELLHSVMHPREKTTGKSAINFLCRVASLILQVRSILMLHLVEGSSLWLSKFANGSPQEHDIAQQQRSRWTDNPGWLWSALTMNDFADSDNDFVESDWDILEPGCEFVLAILPPEWSSVINGVVISVRVSLKTRLGTGVRETGVGEVTRQCTQAITFKDKGQPESDSQIQQYYPLYQNTRTKTRPSKENGIKVSQSNVQPTKKAADLLEVKKDRLPLPHISEGKKNHCAMDE